MMRSARLLLLLLAGGAGLLVGPAVASAQQPYVGWSGLLPGVTTGYDPSSADDCKAGRTRCVEEVIREMQRRFAPLADSCDHDAIFSLAYLRTTEAYRKAIRDRTFFSETTWVNHLDAVFAAVYFDAFDAWHATPPRPAPGAWSEAFQAADAKAVSGTGNLLLGMNAHVQRDLPFVLEAVGLRKRNGASRKPDYDKVNRILDQIYRPLLAEIARRFDPTVNERDLPTPYDNFAIFQVLPLWRELAWHNAERLRLAPTPAARAAEAARIEAYATSQAQSIRAGSTYPPPQDSGARDAYCAAHHNDP